MNHKVGNFFSQKNILESWNTEKIGFEKKLKFFWIFKNFEIFQFPVGIRQIDLKPDRNRILKPEIRPEPDSAGFPVGSYYRPKVHPQWDPGAMA